MRRAAREIEQDGLAPIGTERHPREFPDRDGRPLDECEILAEGSAVNGPSGERSWSHRGQAIEPGCRIAACLVHGRGSPGRLAYVVRLNRGVENADQARRRATASSIRPGEAWRDDRSGGAHAHLPADIFSSTVQLGARGEIVESDPGSPISPHLLPALPGSASLGGPVGTPRVLRNGVVVVRERHQP
jgi:hypothetical protein